MEVPASLQHHSSACFLLTLPCSQARDATATAIDARGAGGLETPMGGATTDLTAIGAGRNTVVQVRAGPLSADFSIGCWR